MDEMSDLESWLEKRIDWVERQLDHSTGDYAVRYFQGQRIAYYATLDELKRDKSVVEAPF